MWLEAFRGLSLIGLLNVISGKVSSIGIGCCIIAMLNVLFIRKCMQLHASLSPLLFESF